MVAGPEVCHVSPGSRPTASFISPSCRGAVAKLPELPAPSGASGDWATGQPSTKRNGCTIRGRWLAALGRPPRGGAHRDARDRIVCARINGAVVLWGLYTRAPRPHGPHAEFRAFFRNHVAQRRLPHRATAENRGFLEQFVIFSLIPGPMDHTHPFDHPGMVRRGPRRLVYFDLPTIDRLMIFDGFFNFLAYSA